MANTVDRAEFWKHFIRTKCNYPASERLHAQFAVAELYDFCTCGCNSFAVRIPVGADVEPIAQAGSAGLAFEADFIMDDEGRTLEIMIFVDQAGNLRYIEIDYCANAFPVPDAIEVDEPFHIRIGEWLLR